MRTANSESLDMGHSSSLASGLSNRPPDPLLALIDMFARDPRDQKIDLGVGVFRDELGNTPVLNAVKAAELRLRHEQSSKAYLGPEGDVGYFKELTGLALNQLELATRVAGVQTPGGTGALRLGAELLAKGLPGAKVYLGEPTWPNHAPLMEAAGLPMARYRHIDLATQQICFEEVEDAFLRMSPGSIALLHGCCHNPTGADFSLAQWECLALLMAERQIFPFVDLAYHGLGDGLERDVAGLRIVARYCPEMLIAYSCDKNFGLYRDRVGALISLSSDAEGARKIQSNLLALARANWSMPPDHGAAIVRIIMENRDLKNQWLTELEAMRVRLGAMRNLLADQDPSLEYLRKQKGMFSNLCLSPDQVQLLRDEHAVYVADSGRINIAGLTSSNVDQFAAALAAVR
jgi:aromatic-amino-acid transaminase